MQLIIRETEDFIEELKIDAGRGNGFAFETVLKRLSLNIVMSLNYGTR